MLEIVQIVKIIQPKPIQLNLNQTSVSWLEKNIGINFYDVQ